MKVNVQIKHVNSFVDSLRIMAGIARKYKNDDAIRKMAALPAHGLFSWLRGIYRREEGEIFQRPNITMKIGRADCDDQAIFVAACSLYKNIPENKIFFALCGKRRITHVFPIIQEGNKDVYFDMLPERKFDERFKYPVFEKHPMDTL